MPSCLNCNTTFEGRYCSACGQKAGVGKLSMHEVFHELVHSFTHADKGIVRLLKELFISPGKMYHAYFAGKRKSYFSPVMFFLLGIGLAIFLGDKVLALDHDITGSNVDFEKTMFTFQKLRYLLFIPVISLLSWGLFYKSYNLAECLVFWFFCSGFICFTELISYIPRFIFVKQRHTIAYFADWFIWILIVYHIHSVFFRKTIFSAVKCLALAILAYFTLVYIYSGIAYFKGYPVDFNFWNLLKSIFS